MLAYENEAIFAQQKGEADRLRRPRPDDPDREPGRRDDRRARPAAAGLRSTSCPRPRRRRSSPRRATGRSIQDVASRVRLPDSRRRCSRSPTWEAGPRSRRSSSTATNGIVAGIEQELGVYRRIAHDEQPRSGRPHCRLRRGSRAPAASRCGHRRRVYLSVIVLIPIAAVVAKSLEGGWAGFWNEVTRPRPSRRSS